MASPYTVHIDQAVLDDLQERLGQTRLPDHLQGSRWDYGTEPSYIQVTNTITSASTTRRLSELTNRSSLTCLCLLSQLASHRNHHQICMLLSKYSFGLAGAAAVLEDHI